MIERIRVEPISTYLERYRKGGVAHPVTIANGFVYLSGLPPFDPESGEIKPQPFERQCELVLEQIKHCLEAAGSSLTQVIKCNVYCVPARRASRPSTPCMTGISRKTRHRASSCSFIRGQGRSTLNWIAWRLCNAVGLRGTPRQPNVRFESLADILVGLRDVCFAPERELAICDVAFPLKADIRSPFDHVRLVPKADILRRTEERRSSIASPTAQLGCTGLC